jgi:hypothetical protein
MLHLKCCREDLEFQDSFTVNYYLSLEDNVVFCCITHRNLVSIHQNNVASHLVLAKRNHTNNPLFRRLCMLPLISCGLGSTFHSVDVITNCLHAVSIILPFNNLAVTEIVNK